MKIILNGKTVETELKSLYEVKETLNFGKDAVTTLNGFADNSDTELCEGDTVTVCEKGKLPPPEVLEAMISARLTPGIYEKLKNARVAVAGLGGLGSAIAESLARSGVGHLHLIDFDSVDATNLNRQRYRICHIGMDKTAATAMQIAEYNPFVKLTAETVRITAENAAEIFKDDIIICEAFDSPESKAELVNAVLEKCPDKIIVASSGMAGLESPNLIKTKRISKNFYLCGDGVSAADYGCGLMAPRVDVCAGHQASTVLRLITGSFEP